MAKKIFISMPMRDKIHEEILSAQAKILKKVSYFLDDDTILVETFLDEKLDPLKCLGENLQRMNTADYVVFAEGYENARGCRIEYTCACEYGKKILLEHGNEIQEVF